MRLRVAILTFYPRDTSRIAGGVRAVAYNLVQGLKRYDDLEIHVVHCHGDIDQDVIVAEGNVTIHYLALPRRRLIPNMTASISRIRRLLQEIKPDVVNAHLGYYALAATGVGYPTAYTIHGVVHEEAKAYTRSLFDRLRYRLYAYYDDLAVRRANELIAISDYVLAEYRQRARGRWHRIDNPVTDDFFGSPVGHPPSGVLHPPSSVVLFAGSITEVKDIITLLKAIALVRESISSVRLHLAGRVTSASYEREIKAYVQEHSLSSYVAFLGLLDRPALLREYAACALVALSSRQENAPMAVIEAMAVGKPVVCTRVGGVAGLVAEGETGYTVPPGDAEQMAERMIELLRDPARRLAMGQRAREQALRRFSVAQVAGQYRQLYWQMHTDALSAGVLRPPGVLHPPASGAPQREEYPADATHTPTMRICLLSERLAPPFDEGFKNVAIHLRDALAARHQVLGLTCFGEDVPEHGIVNVPTNRLLLSRPMWRAIRSFAPQIVYYIPTASATWPSLLRARILRLYAGRGQVALIALQPRRFVVATSVASHGNKRLKSLLRTIPSPDLILAPSRTVVESLPPLRCPVALIPLGVDLARFTPGTLVEKAGLRRRYGLPEKSWVLLHVGHIKRERNVQVLARLQAIPGCQVLLVGSSSTQQEEELSAELKGAGVRVISEYMPITEAYHLADGYIFPTFAEGAAIGIPLSVLEAMACDLPVVSTPFGGLPALFAEQPESGFWYAERDEELVAHVAHMRELAHTKTRAMVAPYSWAQVAELILSRTRAELGWQDGE